MKGISDAILEDVRSSEPSPHLQLTMGQCFTKVMKAAKVYAAPVKEDILEYYGEVLGKWTQECFRRIRDAAENLEEAAN